MKKILILICALVVFVSMIVISTQAQAYSKVDSFNLSDESLTSSGKTFSYNQNNINFTSYVHHWKGNLVHADTARTQIKSATNVSNKNCTVKIYVNGQVNSTNSDPTFAETATSIWQTVSRTYHKITLTGSTGNTFTYEANGR